MEKREMEERIIKRLRVNKKRLLRLYKIVKKDIDIELEMIDSNSLEMLEIISKIDEELTDIIYLIIDNKNF